MTIYENGKVLESQSFIPREIPLAELIPAVVSQFRHQYVLEREAKRAAHQTIVAVTVFLASIKGTDGSTGFERNNITELGVTSLLSDSTDEEMHRSIVDRVKAKTSYLFFVSPEQIAWVRSAITKLCSPSGFTQQEPLTS